MTPPVLHTAAEVAGLLGQGHATAVEIAEFYLDRIAREDHRFHAVIAVDRDGALAAAEASDARRARGDSLGPLDGVPVLIKDNIEAVGLPATAGSRALLDSPPAADAPLVARLRDAGLTVLGSTNLSEWANFRSTGSTSGWSAVGGQTRNPWDTERNTSGSSSGSAAALAAGLAPLAVGTETDGSIVSPAGLCGVVGFKPSRGTIPGVGIVPITSHQDTAGPMGRSVSDVAALFAVLSDSSFALLDKADVHGRTIAIWTPTAAPPEIVAVLTRLTRQLGQTGAVLVSGEAPEVSGPFDDAELDAMLSEFGAELPAYLAARPGPHPATWAELLAFNTSDQLELSLFGQELFERAAVAPPLHDAGYLAARRQCDDDAARALEAILAGADVAVTLSNKRAWPLRYGVVESDYLSTSSPAAVAGAPAVSVPMAWVDGLPIGVTVIGRPGQDQAVLEFARLVETFAEPRPQLPSQD